MPNLALLTSPVACSRGPGRQRQITTQDRQGLGDGNKILVSCKTKWTASLILLRKYLLHFA